MSVGAAWQRATSWWSRAQRSPLTWIVLGALVLHTVGIWWGLPGSDGWDDDGIAPRDFLVGAYLTYQPGEYFTYPPVHLLLLTILTLPVTIVGLVHSASFAPHDVIAELTRVPYMTVCSAVARFVAGAMSIGVIVSVARIGEELWGRRAGHWSAAVVALNVPFTYYAHTSNLDGPYMFWAMLALLSLVRAIVRSEPWRLRRFALFAVLAMGTKDQAYAVFLIAVPLALVAWLAIDARARSRAGLRELGLSIALGAFLLLAIDGAFMNPSGFAARLRFLTGSASQDHAYYARTWAGRLAVLADSAGHFTHAYPFALAPFVVAGIAVHVAKTRGDRARTLAGFLPLLCIASFTIAFNCVARRTEERFLLPQTLLVSLYAGVAFDAVTKPTWRLRSIGWVAALLVGGRALFDCVAVDVALLRDPRYDAEAWLAAHLAPTDVIEVYGNNVYLPRLPTTVNVTRVDPSPVKGRSPLPGVEEIEQRFDQIEERKPTWIVFSEGWVWRYTLAPVADPTGANVLAPLQAERQKDIASRAFFHRLFTDSGGYKMVHVSEYDSRFWPRTDMHASTTRTIFIARRNAP